MKRTLLLVIILALVLQVGWLVRLPTHATQNTPAATSQPLMTLGTWNTHQYDLVYTMAFSNELQPNGPLVVYRASGTDLHSSAPVFSLKRSALPLTPQFFPSPDGQYLALLRPLTSEFGTALNGGELSIVSTDGAITRLLVANGVASSDQVIWSTDSQALYYHTGAQDSQYNPITDTQNPPQRQPLPIHGFDEIHRVDLNGHDVTLLHQAQDGSSLRFIGLDATGSLILTSAVANQPVELLRLPAGTGQTLEKVVTLPSDILPGNVLKIGSDGHSVVCERILTWQPLNTTQVTIDFAGRVAGSAAAIFDTSRFGKALNALSRSNDGRVLVMSQVTSIRNDLQAQGIAGVPAQEVLQLADAQTGAVQRLTLPRGGQIIQAFWTAHLPATRIHTISSSILAAMLTVRPGVNNGSGQNASVSQQDEWMLEAHAGLLVDSPTLPKMCYGLCPNGLTGAPHVSAAILHGIAFVESNWHQFNTSDYDVNGEAVGSTVQSWDGGWGEFQQTWAMPPQCYQANNCRADAARIQNDQSYNIGVGAQSLISAWNSTAGVASTTDTNDPYKANHWFFATWAYNGSYGNNPNDVPSSHYGQWYPGAPFGSIYEEYVWYFAAHPQFKSSGWTDDYLPALGSSLLPPQSDFVNTADSFVRCITCTIPDWTTGSYDREWIGVGAPDAATASSFQALFVQAGGEDIVGLPRDNGSGAAVHRWGKGWAQDMGGGLYLPGALMLADGSKTPYWVYGGVWSQFLTVDHGTMGCHGYPTSALSPYTIAGSGSDTYLRQNFQSGFIVWDATTRKVATDSCS